MNLRDVLKETHNAYGRLKKAKVTIEPSGNSMTCFGRMAAVKGRWPVDPDKDPMVALLVCATSLKSELAITTEAKPGRWPSAISEIQLAELAHCVMVRGRAGVLWCNAGLLHMIDGDKILARARQLDAIQKSIELGGPSRPRLWKFLWSETYEVPLIKTEDDKILLDWVKWCVNQPEQGDG